MKNPQSKIAEIEKHLLHEREFKDRNPKSANIPDLVKSSDVETKLATIDYWNFIRSADEHYFVARVIFKHGILEYSFFCAQQCIENYLKAYLRFKNEKAKMTHDLNQLLETCRKLPNVAEPFIASDYIKIICDKFNPFNEIGRYPIHKKGPKGAYMIRFPYDIYILDYFVFRMREIMTVPSGVRDLFHGNSRQLMICKEEYPDFYQVFEHDNVNCP